MKNGFILSKISLKNVMNFLKAEYFVSNDADIDLWCAVKSKKIVQGKFFFSQLIRWNKEKNKRKKYDDRYVSSPPAPLRRADFF